MALKLLPGYDKANSNNLPIIDVVMMYECMERDKRFQAPEIANVKSLRSLKESYGEAAIGHVQARREGNKVSVIAAVSPEQKVASKSYKVEIIVDIKAGNVTSMGCYDCKSSRGGCKHHLALLAWLHRRSEEPSPTEIRCYWKKSELSKVGKTMKYIEAYKMKPKKRKEQAVLRKTTPPGSFLLEVLDHIELNIEKASRKPEIFRHFQTKPNWWDCIDLYSLALDFMDHTQSTNAEDFLKFCSEKMILSACEKGNRFTESQADNKLWHKLRFARCTASLLHQISVCKTSDGSLVNTLFGAKIMENKAMERGKRLEGEVLKEVEKKTNQKFRRSGLILDPSLPIFGSSPDGINDTSVVEIKCPFTVKSKKNYIKSSGAISDKCLAQIQLQMHMTKRQSGFFCVASPSFEKDRKVQIINVPYNEELVESLLAKALSFWKTNIAPILLS